MKRELTNILKTLELNEIEINVFFATLEAGNAPASGIARIAGYNRITVYEALKRLVKKGLVSKRIKPETKTAFFEAEDIDVIADKLAEKERSFHYYRQIIETLRKDFQVHYRIHGNKPIVLFYEGIEGIKIVLSDTLKSYPREILSFASQAALAAGFDMEFLQTYWEKRVSLGIPSRGILPQTPEAVEKFTAQKNQKELRQVKFLPPEMFNFQNEIDIYGDTVTLISVEEGNQHGIIIRSTSIAQGLRTIFETLWNAKISETVN